MARGGLEDWAGLALNEARQDDGELDNLKANWAAVMQNTAQ